MGGFGKRTIFVVAFAGILAGPAMAQDQKALVARGTYLMDAIVGCDDCHTPKDEHFLPRANLPFAGGEKFISPAFTAYARNITPDVDTGIGIWTDAQIIRAVREGVTREGDVIGPPMPIMTYNTMSDDDVKAIVAYLHTLKPIHHEVLVSKYKIRCKPRRPRRAFRRRQGATKWPMAAIS